MQEQHLITAAKPEHSVSMGTGYYVLAPRKQEVYGCLQAVFTMPPGVLGQGTIQGASTVHL